MHPISSKLGGNVQDMAFMDTVKFRFLWTTDQCVHETVKIMKLPLPVISYIKDLQLVKVQGNSCTENFIHKYSEITTL